MPIYYLKLRFFVLLGLFLPFSSLAQAVSDSTKIFFVKIDSITIEGNKITRKPLILRELEFHVGDSIRSTELAEVLERNRKRVINLQIFNDVQFSPEYEGSPEHLHLRIKVREAWYWFPSPVFELVDRNFNVWWYEFNHSLRRTNYGGDYTQNNITGHADILNLTATAGYNQRFTVRYRTPTINRKQTLGLHFAFTYSRTREVAVTTQENKLVFFSNPNEYAIERYIGEVSLTWRPKLLHFYSFALEHRTHHISDTVAQINPDFFGGGSTFQRHHSFIYSHSYDSRDVRAYPMHGWLTLSEIRQNGLLPGDDLFLTRFRLEATKYTSFNSWLSLETGARIRTSLPRRKPPYFNNQALGYGNDLVRGYEYYVMDGLDLGVFKTSLRTKFWDKKIHYPKLVKYYCKRCKFVETQAYLSIQNDIGYAYDPWYSGNNPLTNKFLYAYGIGIDGVLYRRTAMQLAWMHTISGQNGIYVRMRL